MTDAELDRMERDAREVLRWGGGHPVDDVLALVAEVRRLRATRAELLAELKKTRWCDRDPPFLRCPECGGASPATDPESDGHAPDACDLADAIRRAEADDA
jgi:hypothetical protein